ncbi:MAG: hypothetical protein EBR86_17310 [Planctomycetia bacterium]|nr:hypothetical protein [Planctomycetia bacterium]
MTTEPNDKNEPADEFDDPIVAEVHEIRRQLLEKHGGIEGFMQYIRERDAQRLQREKEEADRRAAELEKSA